MEDRGLRDLSSIVYLRRLKTDYLPNWLSAVGDITLRREFPLLLSPIQIDRTATSD